MFCIFFEIYLLSAYFTQSTFICGMPNNFAALRKSFLQLTKSWNEDGRIGVGMSLIIPRLYIGSFSDAQDEEQLCKNEVALFYLHIFCFLS